MLHVFLALARTKLFFNRADLEQTLSVKGAYKNN